MSPLVVFVAVSVLTVVSMSAEPLPPMPVTAVRVVWPVVASSAVSATDVSVMAAPALNVSAPLVLETSAPRAMLPDVALSVTVPEPSAVTTAFTKRSPA